MPKSTVPSRRPAISLLFLVALLLASLVPRSTVRAQVATSHTITWDRQSLLLDGHRLLLYSGEFHYWRLPSQSQWMDRLEKMKAAGLNAVSIYFDWQYHSNAPGEYDFSGVRDIDYLLSLTEKLGLYVIARVGPYMNAEVDAGGLPGWILTKPLFPRSQGWEGGVPHPQYSPLYVQYSKEWYDHLLPILARHQVTGGGSVILLSIENEYSQNTGSQQYMQDLYNFARADGINVPIFHNDFNFTGDWSKLVDLYAFDSYPYGFDCCHQWWDLQFGGMDTWETTVRNQLNIGTPIFVAELQGGSFDPWGGKGYDAISQTLGPDWLSAIDETALAQGTTILNTYMFTGGTSWGYMTEPGVYSSYDYGAPISESGALRPAYYAAHRLGMFLQRYGPTLAGSTFTDGVVTAGNSQVMVRSRVDPVSGQIFTFLRHGDAGNGAQTKLHLNIGGRQLDVPQKEGSSVTLPGHGAEVLVENTDTGPLHLNYSTSQVLNDADTPGGHYLVLFGPPGSDGETDFVLPAGSTTVDHNADVEVTRQNGELRLNYQHTAEPRAISIQTAGGTLHILVTDTDHASRFWLVHDVLLAGPDLVLDQGDRLQVFDGRSHQLQMYGAPANEVLQIDGRQTAAPDAFMGTTLLGGSAGAPTVTLPALSTWRFQEESPEISPSFDDSSWTLADHTTTGNPNVPPGTTLLTDDYGFHYGFVWYRGHFQASGQETGIALAARHSYSVFLNGVYLGSADASLGNPPQPYPDVKTFAFPPGTLKPGQANVVAVLTESLGHDEGWIAGPAAQSPQGVLSVQLTGAQTPITWRLQGDLGGEHPADSERGLFNASGLYGERNGWYLPGFDDRNWQTVTTPDSWQARNYSGAVGWYRSSFRLNLPTGVDVPLGLQIPHASDKATIWLNGWLIGRYWEQKGPQHVFYLPQGILNPRGANVLAIAVWNRGHAGGLTATPLLVQYPSLASDTVRLVASSGTSVPDTWHTAGNRIVDSSGRPVRIAAVNWSGMQQEHFVPAGLDKQPLDAIFERIRRLGFNTIRLPFSNQLVEQNPVVTDALDANPELKGLHALDVMDRIVAGARQHGLRIILDNHRSDVGTDPEVNGLWYTAAYPESSWIRDWQTLAARYKDDPTVVGADLRDEPHTGPPGPWSVKTYLHQGATWGPYQGVDNEATDWRLAAERGGNAVLAMNPHLLIFVEGLQQYPDPTQPGGVDSYWWGGILGPAERYPVVLSVPHQLVYSPHEYGPLKWQMPFFGPHMTYQSVAAVWKKHWGFLEQPGYGQQTPIFVGEFGTCGTARSCIEDRTPGSQGLWFSFFTRYLKRHPEIGWAFWALNGTNHRGDVQPNYVLRADWRTQRLHLLGDTLRDIETPPPPAE